MVNIRDIGGNSDKLVYNGKETNLHSIWDTEMVENRIKDVGGSSYTDYLLKQINNGSYASEQHSWISNLSVTARTALNNYAVAAEYAVDSDSYSCKGVWSTFEQEKGKDFSGEYHSTMGYLVDLQIAKGGVRLAHHLNQVLDTCSAISANLAATADVKRDVFVLMARRR